MALQISTVADSISKLTISGLNLFDLDEIPQDLTRKYPAILPSPNFITQFTPEVVDISRSEIDFRYTLNYRLLAAPVGIGRGIHEILPDVVDALEAFLYAIATNHSITGAVDIQTVNVSSYGVLTDPAENQYHGCEIQLNVLEFK